MNSQRFAQDAVVGHYRIVKPLGAGGMAQVYLARNEDGRDVALKFLSLEPGDAKATERLIREATCAARIRHSNVVRVYGVEYEKEEPFIVSEFVKGGNLANTRLHEAPIDRLVVMLRDVAEGLAATHAAGIVHRDIKPENVVLKDDGGAVIVDFGLGKRTDLSATEKTQIVLTLPTEIIGTLCYMSPEQVDGVAEISTASDVFSFGALAFELLTGRKLFQRSSVIATINAILRAAAPELIDERADVPAHIARVILECLAKEPRERPRASEVAAELDTLVDAGQRTRSPGGSVRAHVATYVSGKLIRDARTWEASAVEGPREQVRQELGSVSEAISRITNGLEELSPKAASNGGNFEALMRSLGESVRWIEYATALADAVAKSPRREAACEQRDGLLGLVRHYEGESSMSQGRGRFDLDYFRFLAHELYVIQIGALLRARRWPMVDDVLSCSRKDVLRRSEGCYIERFCEYLPSVESMAADANRVSLQADWLYERHANGGVADVFPFRDLVAAEFLLFLRSELGAVPVVEGFEWRPWSTLYLRGVPDFAMDSKNDSADSELADVLRVRGNQTLRRRMIEEAVRLRALWRAGLLNMPLSREDVGALGV